MEVGQLLIFLQLRLQLSNLNENQLTTTFPSFRFFQLYSPTAF